MKLYKYVTAARLDILEGGLIRFTQPSAFSDPFELRPFLHMIGEQEFLAEQREKAIREIYEKNLKRVPRKKRKNLSYEGYCAFIEAHGGPEGQEFLGSGIFKTTAALLNKLNTAKIPSIFDNLIGILCFTETPSNLLMWAHYADSHQGFVIEFDETNSFFYNNDVFIGRKVNYSSKRPSTSFTNIEKLDIYFSKSTEWAYEREWRMVAGLKETTKTVSQDPYDICLFSIPPAAIKSVIIGCRTQGSDIEKLTEMVRNNQQCAHIRLFQAELEDRTFALRIVSANI